MDFNSIELKIDLIDNLISVNNILDLNLYFGFAI